MRKSLLLLLTSAALSPILFDQPAALAQRVVEVSPSVNSPTVSPDSSIYGQFDTTGTAAVDASSVRIFVNGRDVTNRSTVTPNFFSYRPEQPLSPGQVQVRVEFRNVNGESRSSAWAFTVQQPQNAPEITAISHNATNQALGTGARFYATVNGTPGAQPAVYLIQDNQTVRELSAQEVSPGVYVATFDVQASDRLNEGILVGELRRQNQVTFAAAEQPVRINGSSSSPSTPPSNTGSGNTDSGNTGSTTPLQPRFTSHDSGDEIGNDGFTLTGQTRPNATVQVNVTASVPFLNVLNIGNQTLVNREVTANSQGRFELEVPPPQIPVPGLRYTVRATARSGSETSSPTEITLTE